MLRTLRTRRGVSALLVTTLLTLSIVTPAAAGDELIVQRGDTLWDLARRHGVTLADLVAWNRIENPSLIHVGQRIVLQPPAPVAVAPAPPPEASAPVIHVAQAGDTLWDIAIRYGTTVEALAAANGLANPSLIRVGQAIAIPQAGVATVQPATPALAVAPAPAPQPPATVHVVQHGENLWAISARYGVSISAIVQANGIADASFIRTGQRLTIPTTTPAAAAPATSSPNLPPDMAAKVEARSAARDLLLAAAREFGVAPAFVLAVAWHESGWQTGVVSYAGAVGLMQLMPSTATWVADTMLQEAAAINDPSWNARAGTRLLAFYLARYQGDKATTLAAYFQGMTSVEQVGIYQSSQPYIDSILALEVMFSR